MNGQNVDPMVNFYFSAPKASQGVLQVSVAFKMPNDQVELRLPTWRPGRYEIANYAQNILSIDAKGAKIQKLESSKWSLTGVKGDSVIVHYEYYARKMDAGNSWVDAEQLYVNPINCSLEVIGLEKECHSVFIDVPEECHVGIALPKEDQFYIAEDYQHLVDSPFIASASLQHKVFELDKTKFHIWIQGNLEPRWDELIAKMIGYTKPQMDLFGGFPTEDYHYLFQILPYRHYHGVEHQHSTVITLGPDKDFFEDFFQTNLMGISSHELFHTWNVTRIRPKELSPYDFSKPTFFNTGYVAEGVTTYYGDLMLVRGRVFNTQEYFDEINGYFNRHFRNYGRFSNSLSNSSLDLWLDGYKIGAPNRKVSIYIKGALCSLMLDLKIRQLTNSQKSLDDVIRLMWSRYSEQGYTSDDYKDCAEEVIGISLEDYFSNYIFGTIPIETELNQLLKVVGCEMRERSHPTEEAKLGYLLSPNKTVLAIAPNSPVENHLQIGDEQIAPNTFKRNGGEFGIEVSSGPKDYFSSFEIQLLENRSEMQDEAFQKWLNRD